MSRAITDSRTSHGPERSRFRQRRSRAPGLAEALEDFRSPGGVAELERDPPVEIDPFELDVGRDALRPALVREILLRRIRSGASAEDDGKAGQRGAVQSFA
jgi:hypothetical protein